MSPSAFYSFFDPCENRAFEKFYDANIDCFDTMIAEEIYQLQEDVGKKQGYFSEAFRE